MLPPLYQMIDWMMIGCKEPHYIVAVELWSLTGVGTCCHVTSNWFAVQISATRYREVTKAEMPQTL